MNLNSDIFKIKHNNVAPKKGRLLISEPFTNDFHFKRSVVLLTEHNKDGSVGFVLNKPIQTPVNEVMNNFPDIHMEVSLGGPVQTDTIHYIHTLGSAIPNSVKITDEIFWGGDFEQLKLLIESKIISEKQIKFFIGYAGWDAKQLDEEISNNLWLVSDIDSNYIFNKSIDDIWKLSLSQLGGKYEIWSDFPENPNLN